MPSITIPRRTDSVAAASDFIERAALAAGWREPDLSRLVLAVTEAASNAVEHGRGATFDVSCRWEGDVCWLTVADDGPGPAPQAVRDASLPDVKATEGRGLYILAKLADAVSVEGGSIRLELRRSTPQ